MNLLEITGVNKFFGGLQALKDAHIKVAPGQIVGLIGPNGAGKTSFFNVMTGLYPADSGQFFLNAHSNCYPREEDSCLQPCSGKTHLFQNTLTRYLLPRKTCFLCLI